MNRLTPNETWLPSWKESYHYDQLELFGARTHLGYAYSYSNRRKHIIDLVTGIAQPGSRILDVAAAQGNFSIALAEMGYDVTWNDLRSDLVTYVQMKHERGRLTYLVGDIFSITREPTYDVVLAAEIIEHVAHPDTFLQAVAGLVKPHAYVVVTTPNGEYFRNKLPRFSDCANPARYEAFQFRPNADGHIFLLHADELEALAEPAGLRVLEVRLFSNSLTSGHLKSEALLQRLPRSLVDSVERFTGVLPAAIGRRIHTSMAVLLQRVC